MVFVEEFIEYSECSLNFELSKRKSLNLKAIKKQVIELDLMPMIIDISINGYSTKDDFDFEVNNKKWSEVKDVFIKGENAQKDPEALTVKRAIRVCARMTSQYIEDNDIKSHLVAFGTENLEKKFMHLGGAFVVPESQKIEFIKMWQNFDKSKNTHVTESVTKILNYRFPQ
jgi:hypothetical protein